MKIQNTLFEIKQYFETIGKIHSSDQLSVMGAYRINRLVKKLNELNTEYLELKNKLLEQYGTPGEEEGTYVVGKENRKEFIAKFSNLLNIEHDLETEMLTFPIKIKAGISSADLNILEVFFDLSTITEIKDEPEIIPTETE